MGLRNDSLSSLEAHWHSLTEAKHECMRSKCQPREVTRVCFLIRVIKLVTRMQYLLGDSAVDCGVSTLSKTGLIKFHIGGPDVKEAQRGRVHNRNPAWYTWSQSLGAFKNGP